MQHSPDGVWDKAGCFVYRILEPIALRKRPSIKDEHRVEPSFVEGDLISVDLIRHSRVEDSGDGPFLRLSDCSGWLFERKQSILCMEKVPVVVGLWAFFVDNYPTGIALRRHPIDRLSAKVEPEVIVHPMQKIFCDRKVTANDGVNFYRVQGSDGWVFDKRGDDEDILIAENVVRTGLFAYAVMDGQTVAIRNRANVGEECKTSRVVESGDIVAVVFVREPLAGYGNGPFLRLTDGSGWLFEHKHHEQMLSEIPVEVGRWRFRVSNDVGIGVRTQPVDDQLRLSGDTIRPGEECVCDRMISSSSGVNFFRVEGTDGWVFDKRGDHDMMVELPSTSPSYVQHSNQAWTPDFVRGAASAIGCLEEIAFNPQSRLISFRNHDNVRINVFYTTGTIGTAMDHPSQGKTQLFRKNCSSAELAEIMRNPRTHTGRGYQQKRPRLLNASGSNLRDTEAVETDGEEDLRNTLLECNEEMERLSQRQARILKSLKEEYDDSRISHAKLMNERTVAHVQKLQAEEEQETMRQRQLQAEAERETMRQRQRVEAEAEARRRRQQLTCTECVREFVNDHALEQHLRDAHGFNCDFCGKVFMSHHSLSQHKDATDHW